MNILYLLDNPQLYGSEMHLFDILAYMSERHSVSLITFRDGPLIEKIKRIGRVNVNIILSGYLVRNKIINQIAVIVKQNKIQLIHAHQPKAIFIGTLLKKKCKLPLISTIHSQPIDHALVCKGGHKPIVFLFHTFINYWGQLKSDKNVFVSKSMLKNAKFPKKSLLIYNWLRPSIKVAPMCKHIKSNGKLCFASCGSVTHSKGFDILLDFIKKMDSLDICDFEIKVAGGIDKSFLESLKKEYPSEVFKKITFLGYVDNVSKFYEKADFFVLFSRAETFGLVYVEAMAFGLPIMASDLQVFHEIIPEGNCISNNLNEAIEFVRSLLNDEQKYKAVSVKNQKSVSDNFSYIKSMEQLEKLYIHFNY